MKKLTAIVLAGTLCAAGIAVRATANAVIKEIKAQLRPDFTVVVDGEKQNFKNANGEEVYPVLYDGTTYLPVRAIGELMGKTVYWYEDDKRIELKEEKTTVTDADVIITGNENDNKDKDKKQEKVKPEIPEKPEKGKTENPEKNEFIGKTKAKEAALKKAGLAKKDVTFVKVKLDFDDGIYVYEIEFREGRTEYEIEINAVDGTVISFEKDIDD